jgi:hypothetical protein
LNPSAQRFAQEQSALTRGDNGGWGVTRRATGNPMIGSVRKCRR